MIATVVWTRVVRVRGIDEDADVKGDRSILGVLGWTVTFGVAFGWLEAVVVVYLRALFYPEGFGFPLAPMPARLAAIEVSREMATLVMLLAVARLGAKSGWGRFGLFALTFGVWDLAYYGGLYVALGWPASWGDWDVLFLIPGIWTGPVWAPAIIAGLLVACGMWLTRQGELGRLARPRGYHWLLAVGSLVAIVGAFLSNHTRVAAGANPAPFPVVLFFSGIAVGLGALASVARESRPSKNGS